MPWKPWPQKQARILREIEQSCRMQETVENILSDILATLEAEQNQELLRPHVPMLLEYVKHWRKRLDDVHDGLWPELFCQQAGVPPKA